MKTHNWASEIMSILEKHIVLSAKLDAFFAQHGVHVDPDWKPSSIKTEIEDRALDKQMERDSVREEIGSVCQTKDGFWFLQ